MCRTSLQGGWAFSPAELREALGALGSGAFRLSEMHDAAEVLGEIFACLHRCVLLAGQPVALKQLFLAAIWTEFPKRKPMDSLRLVQPCHSLCAPISRQLHAPSCRRASRPALPVVESELLFTACLRRAELGATDQSNDPQLPRRVRGPNASAGRPGSGPAMANGRVGPDRCTFAADI